MSNKHLVRLEDDDDILAAPLVEGVPEWIEPRGIKGVPSCYYRTVSGNETLWDALSSFKTDGISLVSHLSSGNYGKTVPPGQMGLYFNRGRARFRRPGKYWRCGYRCEWSRYSKISASETLIRHGDIEIVQLGQNQTAIVLLPDQSVALLPPGRHILRDRMRVIGEGVYNRAGIDERSGQVSNFVQHVYDQNQWRATLVDVPKDMAAVIERVAEDGAELAIVPPGRYTLTEEGVKFKKLLTLFEEERTVEKIQAWCNDSVEVFVDLQLRFKLESPRLIAHTKYADAFDVLQESAQSAVQSVVGQINYQQMMQSISLAPGDVEVKTDTQGNDLRDFIPFDEQVRLGCREYLQRVGCRVGVKVIDCFVKGRYFNEALTAKMQAQASSTLESVTKAKNIKRDLETERKKVEAEAINAKTRADAEYYSADRLSAAKAVEVRARAAADAEATERMAGANAKAKELLAEAEAKAKLIEAKAAAEAEVARRNAAAHLPGDGDATHAQKLALMKAYAQVASSFGDKTVVLDSQSEMGKMFSTMTAGALAGTVAQR